MPTSHRVQACLAACIGRNNVPRPVCYNPDLMNASSTIKAIFFDVGHTLIQPALPTSEVCRRVLHAHGYTLERAIIKTAMQQADIAHMAHYHSLSDDWARPATILALWLRYYRDVFDRLGLPGADDQLAHELVAWYARPNAWQPFPDVHTALAELHQRGFVLGAVSDWAPSLASIIHGHGLSRYLSFVLSSGSIGVCKPSVQFYQLALQRAQVEPHQALHIGDSYYADVRGARAAGITPVLLDRGGDRASSRLSSDPRLIWDRANRYDHHTCI